MFKRCALAVTALIALSSASYAIQDHTALSLDQVATDVGQNLRCQWYVATLLGSDNVVMNADHAMSLVPGLVEQDFTRAGTRDNIDKIAQYFGAGFVWQDRSGWSLTVESGAYFSDSRSDRALLLHPDHGDQDILLDDLDSADRAAVGERHARSIRPVSHLVIRRRF